MVKVGDCFINPSFVLFVKVVCDQLWYVEIVFVNDHKLRVNTNAFILKENALIEAKAIADTLKRGKEC